MWATDVGLSQKYYYIKDIAIHLSSNYPNVVQ